MSEIVVEHVEQTSEQPNALDVAYWFLLKGKMDQKKIQKLSYYAQAWSHVLLGRDIADKMTFEAWVHGPVNLEIRSVFAKFRWNEFKLDGEEGKEFALKCKELFNKQEEEVLESVWETYGHLTGNQLEVLTHQEDPWINARKGLEPRERSANIILESDMVEYYSSIYNG